jgi:hypothetical protein
MTKKSMVEKLREIYEKHGIIQLSKMSSISVEELCEMLDLNLKTFDDIEFITYEELGGVGGKIVFDNGYGASVVSHNYSYGGNSGLYELTVLDKDGELTYDTPITSDVLGYLSPEQVTEYLFRIQDLKS